MQAPINIKSNYSLLESMIKIDDLIDIALKNNIKALTIADKNMYGALEFYEACLKNNIKPIIGLEVFIPEKINFYAMNYQGYKNLMKLTTLKENLNIDILKLYADGLVCLVPYESMNVYDNLKKIYKYIFITYKNDEEKVKISFPNTLYAGEILCINKDDEIYLKYLKAIKDGKSIKEVENKFIDKSLFPLRYCNNNEYFVSLCNLEIKMHNDLLPIYDKNLDAYQELKRQCIDGMRRIFGNMAPKKYAIRLKKELDIIKKMGFCDYFLIVADYVKYAKEHDILVGPGRGSAAGSLVSYCLNITSIDPLKYNLLFERFLNPERITMPDIDVDFEDEKREDVIKYCLNRYGHKNVSLIVTFGTLASRQAIKDVSRTLGLNADGLCKLLNPKFDLRQNYKLVKQFLEENQEFKLVYKVALKLEGLKRHTSLHAAGIIMSKYEIDDYVPLDKVSTDFYACEYDKDSLEKLGLLKMDFLGLRNLTFISNVLKEAGVCFDDIPDDDLKALNIFTQAKTVGIFQFESEGMKKFLKKFKPITFEDVVSSLALFRPGPMNNIDLYIRRRNGLEKINYFHESLKSILEPTYGIIVYQEQIMQIANVMAGYSLAEADLLRRAMSKKSEDILIRQRDKFIKGSMKNGYDEKTATDVYEMIFKFASYGFNRSHSVAYALISYRMAYLKAHYPQIFMKHLLSSVIRAFDKTKEYIYECQQNNIIVCKPDINLSGDDYKIINNNLVFPLSNIKGVSTGDVKTILDERKNGKYKDIFDFVCRCHLRLEVFQNLIYASVFDKLGINKKTLIQNLDIIQNYSEIGQYVDDSLRPELTLYKEFSKSEIMQKEIDVFGFYLTVNPILEYKKLYPNVISLKDSYRYFDKNVQVIGSVLKFREIETKKGDKMMFLTINDELSQIEVVIFPKIYQKDLFVKGDFLMIKGKIEKRYDEYQLIAGEIVKLK